MSRSGIGTFASAAVAVLAAYGIGNWSIDNMPNLKEHPIVNSVTSSIGAAVDRVSGVAGEASEKIGATAERLSGMAGDVADSLSRKADELAGKADEVSEGLSGMAGDVTGKVKAVTDRLTGMAGDAVDQLSGMAGNVRDAVLNPDSPRTRSSTNDVAAPAEPSAVVAESKPAATAEVQPENELDRLRKMLSELGGGSTPQGPMAGADSAAKSVSETVSSSVSAPASETATLPSETAPVAPTAQVEAAKMDAAPAAGATPAQTAAPAEAAAPDVAAAAPSAEVTEPAAGNKIASLPSVGLSVAASSYVAESDAAGKISLSGQSEPGATLRLTIDGDKLGKATADASGNWNLSTSKNVAVGPHWIVIEQIDAKGEAVARAELPFDRAAPAVETTVAQAAPVAPATPTADVATPAVVPSPAMSGDAAKAVADTASAAKTETPRAEPAVPMAGSSEPAAVPGTVVAGNETIPAMPAGEPGAGGIKQTATKLWEKVTGIFTVDPSELRKTSGSDMGAGQPAASMAAGETGMAASGMTGDKQGAGMTADATDAPGFAFTGVAHRSGRSGSSLRLSGVAAPGDRIQLFDGDDKIGEVRADKKGAWTFDKRGPTAAGPHMFRAGRVASGGRIDAEVRMQYDQVASSEPATPSQAGKTGSAKPAAVASGKGHSHKAGDKLASASVSGKASGSKWGADKSSKKTSKWGSAAKKARVANANIARQDRRARSRSAYAVGRAAQDESAAARGRVRKSGHGVRIHTPENSDTARERRVRIHTGDTMSALRVRHCGAGQRARAYYAASGKPVKNPNHIEAGSRLKIICA